MMFVPFFARTALLAAGLALSACATTGHVARHDPVPEINNTAGVAVKGYDPVAYFTDMRPVEGSPAIAAQYRGATYLFATEAHRDAFQAMPEHYAPQFGGFCSFAISRGFIQDVDPKRWAVVGDRLYLNYNGFAQAVWDTDRTGNIAAGNSNWPLVPKLPVMADAK